MPSASRIRTLGVDICGVSAYLSRRKTIQHGGNAAVMSWFGRKRAKLKVQSPKPQQQDAPVTNPGVDEALPDRPSLDGYTVRELNPNQAAGTMKRNGRDRS